MTPRPYRLGGGDGAGGAVDGDLVAGGDAVGGVGDADDGGDAVLAGHDGAVASWRRPSP